MCILLQSCTHLFLQCRKAGRLPSANVTVSGSGGLRCLTGQARPIRSINIELLLLKASFCCLVKNTCQTQLISRSVPWWKQQMVMCIYQNIPYITLEPI